MIEKWKPEYELEYWLKYEEKEYINKINDKYKYFKVEEIIKKHFNKNNLNFVIDIGGGKYGGFLYFFKDGRNRVLFDFLADSFVEGNEKLNKLPKDIKGVAGSFCDIPFSDNSIDIIFCCEALDHSDSYRDFLKAQKEIVRVLSVGGLLFFEIPLRTRPIQGHPVVIGAEKIVGGFGDLTTIHRNDSAPPVGSGTRLCLVMKKG